MPYEDLLQKQIDRFAAALAKLLKGEYADPNSKPVSFEALDQMLLSELEVDLGELEKMSHDELQTWFLKPPFSNTNRDACLNAMLTVIETESKTELTPMVRRLIEFANQASDSISLERLEAQERLSKLSSETN